MANIIDIDTWREVGAALMRNKTRSFLTGFGIFWGVLMLVLLWSGGTGVITYMQNMLAGTATNIAVVSTSRTGENYKGFKKGRRWELTNTDVQSMRANVHGLRNVVPMCNRWNTRISAGSRTTTASIKGVDRNLYNVTNVKLMAGRMLTPADNNVGIKVITIGEKVASELFPDGDAVGRQVNLAGGSYTVVGIVKQYSENVAFGGNDDESVHMPMPQMQVAFNLGNTVDYIIIEMSDGVKADDVIPQIRRAVYRNHSIAPTDEKALPMFDAAAMFNMFQALILGLRMLAILVGAGTLFAGLIGVSNIMMVILKERTGEIGIRRAIGARPAAILWQFLMESTVLTLSAGLSGLVVAVMITAALQDILDFPLVISFNESLGITMLFIVLGIGAGILPARNAMKIKPIEAMRDK